MIIIKSTLLRKPLHYLIWWGNMDMRWSWWRVISINLNSPSLLYVLLLNLPFRIWMYSANISEVWNQMLLKNPIYFELMLPCVCSFIKSGFSYLNSQCENFWNLETKYVAEKNLICLSSCFLVIVVQYYKMIFDGRIFEIR